MKQKGCLILLCFGFFVSAPLLAQINDSLIIEKSDVVELNGRDMSDEELRDKEISRLLEEISQISNEDLDHEQSILQFHYILSGADMKQVMDEINRIRLRQDFYQNASDYVLPITMVDIEKISELQNVLESGIQQYQKERFLSLVLIKSQMNIFYYQKDFISFLRYYAEYKKYFTSDDPELYYRLTDAYIQTHQLSQAVKIAEQLYDDHPESADAFLNYTHSLTQAGEFAELEYYLDKILLYNDTRSLIHLAIFQYSRGRTAEAASLVHFVDEWIQESLISDYHFDIQDFSWNYNRQDIYIKTNGGLQGHVQVLQPEELSLLAGHIVILDERLSCRFYKYAYMSSFPALNDLFLSDDTVFMNSDQMHRYKNHISLLRGLIENIQKTILDRKMVCD